MSSRGETALPHTQQRNDCPSALNAIPAAVGVERRSTASTRIGSGPNRTHAHLRVRPRIDGNRLLSKVQLAVGERLQRSRLRGLQNRAVLRLHVIQWRESLAGAHGILPPAEHVQRRAKFGHGRQPGYGHRMDAWMMLGEMLRPWVVPVGSALAGAVTGGVVARVVSSGEARRVRRERYGQNILAALGSAGIAARRAQDQAENEDYLHETGQAPEGPEDISEPLMLPSEAREIWVNTQLAASIERGHTASRAMNGWAFHMHESLLAGMRKAPELERLREQLRLGSIWSSHGWRATPRASTSSDPRTMCMPASRPSTPTVTFLSIDRSCLACNVTVSRLSALEPTLTGPKKVC